MASVSMAGFSAALMFAFPVLAYLGMRQGISGRWMAMGLILILGLRWGRDAIRKLPRIISVGGILILLVFVWVWGEISILFYPVAVNLTFLIIFGASLWFPPPIIERLARIQHPDLNANGIRYTRKVTWVWFGFFAFNGCVALISVLNGNKEYWAIYNGFIAYLLMGLLFAIEWLVRRRVMAHGKP